MSKALTTVEDAGEILEQVIIEGDLAKLSPADRVSYYKKVCASVGLNPFSKPFDYIRLNGKLILYARRDAADQLRALHGVSIKVISKTLDDGLYTVHVAAVDKKGRTDEDIGAVMLAGLRGEAKANAMAKAMTKAKRRVTLSICGLGWLDETEVSDIAGAKSPTETLDELFPADEEDAAKTEGRGSPQIDMKEDQAPIGVEKPDAPTGLTTAPVAGIALKVGEESYDLENAEEFFKEYLKQLQFAAETDDMPCRERMTRLKELEQLNMDSLDAIPAEGKKKLIEWRKKLNRKLGALAKKEGIRWKYVRRVGR